VALERIVGLLREFESFSGLIKQRSEVNIPTRIIPVSALGNDFAKWDRERQVMEKPKVGTPKPINIDLTLAFALSDTILVHALRKIDPKDERRTWWLWAGGKTFSGAKEILRILKRLPLDIPYLPRTLSHLEQVAGETMEKLDERREALEAQINGAKTHNEAMELILAAQDAKKRVFLSKNPAADLIGR
jgi:hypothetical protein